MSFTLACVTKKKKFRKLFSVSGIPIKAIPKLVSLDLAEYKNLTSWTVNTF